MLTAAFNNGGAERATDCTEATICRNTPWHPERRSKKIPVEFRYQFRCAEVTCRGHRIMCTDWEMGESYRRWRDQYGERWEAMFRQRYERDMIEKNDTHFYVGNIHQHPDNWLIVGLFYPPMPAIGDLFDA